MEQKLASLAGKVEQVAALVERLQSEKAALEARLAQVEAERDALGQNIESARLRVETLMRQLPEGA
jgi:chromosome segregation ATPase